MRFAKRDLRAVEAETIDNEPNDAPSAEALPASNMADSEGIPAHVWQLLQEAGEQAASKLLDMLKSKAFDSYAPTAKARLIELAFTRAYGLPIRRSVDVSLSSSDADAVAQSLLALRDSLPERRQGHAPQSRTIDGETRTSDAPNGKNGVH